MTTILIIYLIGIPISWAVIMLWVETHSWIDANDAPKALAKAILWPLWLVLLVINFFFVP